MSLAATAMPDIATVLTKSLRFIVCPLGGWPYPGFSSNGLRLTLEVHEAHEVHEEHSVESIFFVAFVSFVFFVICRVSELKPQAKSMS